MSLTHSGRTWDDTTSPGIELLVRRYKADWRSSPKDRPNPRDYLPDDPQQRPAVLLALLRTDLVLRWGTHEQRPVECYRDQFPELDDESLVALLYEEYCLREETGGSREAGEYAARFPDIASSFQEVLEIHDLIGRARGPRCSTQVTSHLSIVTCNE